MTDILKPITNYEIKACLCAGKSWMIVTNQAKWDLKGRVKVVNAIAKLFSKQSLKKPVFTNGAIFFIFGGVFVFFFACANVSTADRKF
jgi:hypothetical protein